MVITYAEVITKFTGCIPVKAGKYVFTVNIGIKRGGTESQVIIGFSYFQRSVLLNGAQPETGNAGF